MRETDIYNSIALKIKELEKENKKLKKRIKKALEMFELTKRQSQICTNYIRYNRERYDEIINILKGSDKE